MPTDNKKRVIEHENTKVNPGSTDAKSSHQALFFHDIPPEFLRRVAKRYTVGHVKYSPGIVANINWRKGLLDPVYIADRLNHVWTHMLLFLQEGNQTDDNLGAMAWGIAFLMEAERVSPDTFKEVIGHCNYSGLAAELFQKELEESNDRRKVLRKNSLVGRKK